MSALLKLVGTPGTNQNSATVQHPPITRPVSVLTAREHEVLHLMADGLTTKDIGFRLNITFKTAACHRNHILQKLSVTSTVSAVRWGIREGLILP